MHLLRHLHEPMDAIRWIIIGLLVIASLYFRSTCTSATEESDPPTLVCPPLPKDTVGICVELCSADDDCNEGQKCCSNGCGHVCTNAIPVPPSPSEGKLPPTVDCSVVRCATPFCPDPLPPPPGHCCPVCSGQTPPDCTAVECPKAPCDGPHPLSPVVGYDSASPTAAGLTLAPWRLCCPGFSCNPGMCFHRGRAYRVGEHFPAEDGCNTCYCTGSGFVLCDRRPCAPAVTPPLLPPVCKHRGKDYQVGESFKVDNFPTDCNTCVCREGANITCTQNACLKGIICPPDKPIMNCKVDPCQVTDCAAHPDATCEADYCGGCRAKFFDSDGKEVTDTCDPECPPECTVGFCRHGPKENKKALCSIPKSHSELEGGCTGQCQVTYCHACYFSEEPREPDQHCTTCGAPVTDLTCLKRWANCVRKSGWAKAPREQRTEVNFRCYHYPCPQPG